MTIFPYVGKFWLPDFQFEAANSILKNTNKITRIDRNEPRNFSKILEKQLTLNNQYADSRMRDVIQKINDARRAIELLRHNS